MEKCVNSVYSVHFNMARACLITCNMAFDSDPRDSVMKNDVLFEKKGRKTEQEEANLSQKWNRKRAKQK